MLQGSNGDGGDNASSGNFGSNSPNKNTVSNPKDLPKASKSTETQGKVKLQFTKRGSTGVQADIEDSKEFDGLWDPVAQPKLKRKKLTKVYKDKSKAAQASLTVTDKRIDEANAEGKKRIDNQEDISGYLAYVQTVLCHCSCRYDGLCSIRKHQTTTQEAIKVTVTIKVKTIQSTTGTKEIIRVLKIVRDKTKVKTIKVTRARWSRTKSTIKQPKPRQ